MVSCGSSTAPGGEFPPISPKISLPAQTSLPPTSPTHIEEPERNLSDRKNLKRIAKPAFALPLVARTPKSSRDAPSASTTASPSACASSAEWDEQEFSRNASLASKGGGENARLLADGVTYKGETCSVHVCGTSLDISSPHGQALASIPVHGVVARFEQDPCRASSMICSIVDWEFYMISSIPETVEKIWRLEMSSTEALTFRGHLEKLGIVQIDLAAQFQFKKFIGKGAFSDVYQAKHVETKSKVAAKVMKKPLGYPDSEVDTAVWDEFSQEVKMLTMAQGQENILRFHSTYVFRASGEQEIGPCSLVLITEHLDISLMDLVKKNGTLPETSTRGVAESLLRATAHLNAIGLVHRDIKMSNVMLRSGTHGGVVLVDYGFATKHGGGLEKSTNVVGTVGYLAPELMTEGALVDLRYTDVFSIGIVTLTCLRGKSVFQGREKSGGTSDRAKYYENKACEIDWDFPASRLSPVGLDALKALLEIDPFRRPLATDAVMSQWYGLSFENCVRGVIPEAAERKLMYLTNPRSPLQLEDAAPAAGTPGGAAEAAPAAAALTPTEAATAAALTPTAPTSPAPERADRPRAAGRRHRSDRASPDRAL